MRAPVPVVISVLICLTMAACPSTQTGMVNGTVSPASADARVSAKVGDKTIATASPDVRTGDFTISLAPGTYDIAVVSSSSQFPVSFSGVIVAAGKSVSLGVIDLAPRGGAGTITGRIVGGKGARVALVTNGRERASAVAGPSGKYELKELPAGTYMLQVEAQDYARDGRAVVVGEGQQAAVNIRLLYITAVDGVDWGRGRIRVRGVGAPPPQAATPTVRRELAKRAALAAAQRDLLRVVAMIETGPGEKLSTLMGQGMYIQKLEGYLSGFQIAAERELDGGRVEIELELPLTGPGGLSSYLPAE